MIDNEHANQGSQSSSVPTYTLVVHNVAYQILVDGVQMVSSVSVSVCLFILLCFRTKRNALCVRCDNLHYTSTLLMHVWASRPDSHLPKLREAAFLALGAIALTAKELICQY